MDESLAGWTFHVEEVSAGVFRVTGVDNSGRTLQLEGTDPDTLLEQCKRDALRVSRQGTQGLGASIE